MYPVRDRHLTKRTGSCCSIRAATGLTPPWFVWILAVVLLMSAGIAYRVLASHLKLTPVTLPVALSAFPAQIGYWAGEDVSIPANIQRIAGNDDFLNRSYTNKSNNLWVNVYIAYTARPRTMVGHQPRLCYVAGGWVHDDTQAAQIALSTGREIPCLIHWFHRPAPDHEDTVVLNFYIVNGRLTSDERVFSGVGFRTPNIDGDPARYVAQVQISSAFENSVRTAAEDMVELMLEFLPDENGEVRAVEYVKSSSDVQK